MRRLSTLSPKTTSTSGDDVNVNVNAQYNVNHLTVTPQLHLHLHLGIQFYLTAPQLPSSPYMSPTHGPDARDERSRRRPEAAREPSSTASILERVSSLHRFGLQPLSVSRQVFYIFISIFAGSCSRGSLRSPGCSVPRAGSLPSPMVDVDDASPSGSESQASHTACVGPCHRTPAPPGRAAALVVHCSSASVKRAPKRSRARSWLQVPNQEGT